MEKSHRLNYLDSAKGFSILLVVLAHICNQVIIGKDPLAIWINSFHLPLFFIVSGFLISYKNEKEQKYTKLFFKKARTIMYPYLTFSILYLLFSTLICIIKRNLPFREISQTLFDTLTLWGISILWFLPALFIGEIAFLLIIKVKNTLKSIFLILSLLAIGIILSINFGNSIDNPSIYIKFFIIISRSIFAIFFIGIGYYFYQFKIKHFDKVNNNTKLIIGIILFVINIFASMQHVSINLRMASIGNIPLYIFTGVIGSISILILFEQCSITKIFEYPGRNSLIIMATHLPFPIIYIAKKLLFFMTPIIGNSNYLYGFSIFTIVICLELIIVKIINSYMPFMMKVPQQFQKSRY